jgi:serine protease Do
MKHKILALGIGLLLLGNTSSAARPDVRAEDSESRARQMVTVGRGARLGVSLADVERGDVSRLKLTDERGAVVKDVADDSPAARAGVKAGDVILSFQGEPVRSAAQLARLVRETPAGRHVGLEVSRDGSVQKLSCELGGRSQADLGELAPELRGLPDASQWRDFGRNLGRELGRGTRSFGLNGRGRLGIAYQEISGQLAQYFKLDAEQGVLVTNVEPDSPADKAGVKAGDVLVSMSGHAIEDGGDLREALQNARAGHELSLKLMRDGRSLDLTVTLRDTESDRGRAL